MVITAATIAILAATLTTTVQIIAAVTATADADANRKNVKERRAGKNPACIFRRKNEILRSKQQA